MQWLPWLHTLLILTIISLCQSQGLDGEDGNTCIGQTSCGQCIQSGKYCGWCTQAGYDAEYERCDLLSNLIPNGCDDAYIVRPNHNITNIVSTPVQNAKGGQDAIQLSPQELTVKIRPNSPFKFNVNFRQAENYPVDLYFVMDLSKSMEDDKDKLAKLGTKLAESMSNITKDFHLGFGSFVDKKTMPYVSMVPAKLQEPCDKCAPPYGFKNQLKLTVRTSIFAREVQKASISGNLDGPEGGFDAMMQAVACESQIGWRKQSRKMVLFSTDAGFHYAGDGKLGGIVMPNDGQCHLDSSGMYTESLNQDYPSISQLVNKIAEKKVNVIFAVTENQIEVYKKLSDLIDASRVGRLASDSSNIVELVKKNYEDITSTLELKTEGAEDIMVEFKTACKGNTTQTTAKCEGLGIGQMVTYEVTVKVKKCPQDKKQWKKWFNIFPVGLTEKLRVNLEMICECECELPKAEEKNSPKCNNSGTFECGACTCNEDRYGKHCECDATTLSSDDYTAACRMPNTSSVCQDHGNCVCGVCICGPITPNDLSRKYSGKYCNCDDYSCDYHEGKLCGGRGVCECGTCKCEAAYNGTACNCPISKESCRANGGKGVAQEFNLKPFHYNICSPGLEANRATSIGKPPCPELCNGKGECECGRCKCIRDTYYRGPTCEDCPTCPGKCEQNKECVRCRAHTSGELSSEDCQANCTHVEVVDELKESSDRKLCQFRDDDDCMFYFTYEYNSDKVQAQKTKKCPKPVNVLAIVLGVIGGIVAFGLALLLIWKLFTTIHDRREFAKFETERQNAKWDTAENPIYKQATSTFKNPTYSGKS